MTDSELLTAADVQLMQGLAQRVTAVRPDMISADASYGELAWIWGQGCSTHGDAWRRRFWYSGDELVAWGWAALPRQVRRSDGSIRNVTDATLAYQVHPDHLPLIDDVIDWYDEVAAGLDRTAFPTDAEEHALKRWAAHGYEPDPDALSDTADWTQLNRRDLTDIQAPVLPQGFHFRTADEVGPAAAVQAHLDAWAPSTYSAQAYEAVRATAAYRCDLHILVEAPDSTMAASTIMWFDPANKTVEFEPVGTHPAYRRQGIASAMMLHAMHQARTHRRRHPRHRRLPGRPRPPVGPRPLLQPGIPRNLPRRPRDQGQLRPLTPTHSLCSPPSTPPALPGYVTGGPPRSDAGQADVAAGEALRLGVVNQGAVDRERAVDVVDEGSGQHAEDVR